MQGPDVFPIPGTKRLKYLEENAAAFFVELTPEDKQFLEDTFHEDKVSTTLAMKLREMSPPPSSLCSCPRCMVDPAKKGLPACKGFLPLLDMFGSEVQVHNGQQSISCPTVISQLAPHVNS